MPPPERRVGVWRALQHMCGYATILRHNGSCGILTDCLVFLCLLQFGPVNHIEFCESYPYNFAVTASTRVSVRGGESAAWQGDFLGQAHCN